jgi:predicted amidohydrolase YtcJ
MLKALLIEAATAGFERHMHADGDRAIREGLDGVEARYARTSRVKQYAQPSPTTR